MTPIARIPVTGAALLLLAFGVAWTAACSRPAEQGGSKAAAPQIRYHCPMHTTYVSDKPGNCPICGMKLVPIPPAEGGTPAATPAPAPAAPAAAGPGRRIAFYRSPMDPAIHSDTPAKDSMGMDFVPVYQDEVQAAGSGTPGRAVVTLTPERRSLLGIQSAVVLRRRIVHTIRTVGRVVPDERRLYHVHTKFEGYVERLMVDFTGQHVRKGDPLLSIYSPELVATQQEYLLALRAQQQFASSEVASVARGGVDLLSAARERLLLWDIRPQDIVELERTGTVRRTLDLYSDVSGFVVQKNVYQGMRVMPSDTLFDIADLSHLWVLADVYTSDLPSIRLGMASEVSLSYLPGRTWRGPVTNIAPTVDEKTRTIKVRVEVDNQDDALKPDMFADVLLRADLGEGLVVPEGAVIDTGNRTLVFIDRADGRLEPREVLLGTHLADGFQVVKGLSEGDRVVTTANFLLDSESSLRSALAAMGGPAPAAPGRDRK